MKKYFSGILIFSFLISFIPVINAETVTENTKFYIFSEDFSEYGVTKNTNFRDYPKSLESTLNGGVGFSSKWSESENEVSDFTTVWPKLSTQLGGSAYGYGGVSAYRNIENPIALGSDGKFIVEFTMSANTSEALSGIKLGNIKIGNSGNKAVLEISDNVFLGEKAITAKESYTYVAGFEIFADSIDKVSLCVYSTAGSLADSIVLEYELGTGIINNVGMIFNSTPTYISKISVYEEFSSASKNTLIKRLEAILTELPEGTDYLTKDNYSEILNDAKIYVDKIIELYGEDALYEVSGYEKYHNSVHYNNSDVQYKVNLSEFYNSTIYASENSTTGENPNVITGPNCGFEIDLFKAKSEWQNEWGENEYNIYLLEDTEYLMRVKGKLTQCAYRTAAKDRSVDVLDVKDGRYGELDLLVNTDNMYYSSGGAYVGVVLQYENGERVLKRERIYGANTDRGSYQNQISGTQISATDKVVDGTLYIHEVEIPVDKTKTLTSIEVLQSYATLNDDMTDVSGFDVTETIKQTYRTTIYAMTLKQTVQSLKEEAENELENLLQRLPDSVNPEDAIYYRDVVKSIDELIENKFDGLFVNFEDFDKFSIYKELKEISYEAENIKIYVSTNGKDSNSGKESAPLESLKTAVEKVKNIKADNPGIGVEVIFKRGEYIIDETVLMDSQIIGEDEHNVVFKAESGEEVVFKGSVPLNKDNFKKVTDEAILERLPENAKNKVLVMDLEKEGITSFSGQSSGGYGGSGIKYNTLFADGEEKTLARWPNSGFGNINKIEDSENRIISINETLAKRWVSAKDIVLDCFFSQDYACDKLKVTAVDSENSTITVGGNVTLNSTASGRFYAYNLIEELDMPGEYYIEDGMLYYYPDGEYNSLELSVLKDDFIKIENTGYINFEGITFEKSCGNILNIINSDNIKIENCKFKDIGRYSVYSENVQNLKVTNCDFYNLGSTGVTLKGGNYKTLESGNNEVSNCTFNKFSQFRRTYAPAVSVSGVGAVVKNNVMHNSPHEAIAFDGNEHKLLYNEIYDVCLETYDCGAIYGGRNLYKRGVEIAYNYIHNVKNEYFPKSTAIKGVYFDDRLSEGHVHNNIIVDAGEGIFVHGGQDMDIHENIVVDCVRGISVSHCGYDGTAVYEEVEAWIKENPLYLEKYPMLAYVSKRGDQHPRGNVIKDNLIVNSGEVNVSDYVELGENLETQSIIQDNLYKGMVSFKDSENHNYEITDSEVLTKIPGLENFDVSQIGLQGRESDKLISDFKLNKVMVEGDNATFAWGKSENADCYRILLAKDKEFRNVIEEKIVFNEKYDTTLEKGKLIFWKVYAVKDSLNQKAEIENLNGAVVIIIPETEFALDKSIDVLTAKLRIEELFLTLPEEISYTELSLYKDIADEAENLIKIGFPIPVSEILGFERYIAYKDAENYSRVVTEYGQATEIIKGWHGEIDSETAYSKIPEYGEVLDLIENISSKECDVTELTSMAEFINMKNAMDNLENEFVNIDISDKFNAHTFADKNTETLSNPNVITGDNFGFEINGFKNLPGWKYDWREVTDYFNILRFDGVNFNLKVREGKHSNQNGRKCAWRTTANSEYVLIDIDDGYYRNISFLVNTDTKWYGTSHNTGYLGVIYCYDDGSEVLEYKNIYHGADATGEEPKITCDKISTQNEVSGKLYLYKQDFTPNATKKLTGIKILQTYAYLNEDKTAVAGVYESGGKQDFRATIYAVTGEMLSLENTEKASEIEAKINALPDDVTAGDIDAVDLLEKTLSEAYDIGIKNISNILKYQNAQKRLGILAGIKVLDVDFGSYELVSAMAGKTVPIVAEISNERYKEGLNAKCYMALFDESGALKGVESKEISLSYKESDVFEFNFSVPDAAKDDWKFKIYFWEGQSPKSIKFNVN